MWTFFATPRIKPMNAIVAKCTINALQAAAENLRNGGLVAFPTETVYGIGADASNTEATKRMYLVKNRPADHPVIVHIADLNDVDYWAQDIPDYAITLMRDFWPGPMTLLLQRTSIVKDFITGGQNVVGIRIPANTIALNLLTEFRKLGGRGIAAPSANRYGAVSPTTANAVIAELQDYLEPRDQILDGGSCVIGIESTIIDCTKSNPAILRHGAITAEMIEVSTGIVIAGPSSEKIRVSGSDKKHYAPNAKVHINTVPQPGHGLIALAEVETPTGVIRLAAPKSIEEYARIFYAALRDADLQNLKNISVVPPAGDGLAVAIRDRISRAAA